MSRAGASLRMRWWVLALAAIAVSKSHFTAGGLSAMPLWMTSYRAFHTRGTASRIVVALTRRGEPVELLWTVE